MIGCADSQDAINKISSRCKDFSGHTDDEDLEDMTVTDFIGRLRTV